MKYNRKAVIDVETLEVWTSITECAAELKVSMQAVSQAINLNGRTGGKAKRKIEYFDYWLESYTPAEKEKFTRKNGVFWFQV